MRPFFARSSSPDDKLPDEALFPATEHPDTHKDGIALACHPVTSNLKISEETGNNISGAQGEKEVSGSWNISSNDPEDDVSSDTLAAKWKLIVSTSAKEATNGGEGIHQLPSGSVTRRESSCDAQSPKLKHLFGQEGVELRVDSEKRSEAVTGHISSSEHKMHDGPVNAMCGIWLSGTSGNTLENLNLLPTNVSKIFDCNSERLDLAEKEGKNFVYRLNQPEIKEADHPPGSPTKRSLSLKREDLKESQAGNSQDIQYHAESTPMQPVTRAADNLDRNMKQRKTVVAVRREETESRTKTSIGRSTGDKMNAESHLCSNIQPAETDKVYESPVRGTELKESGGSRDEPLMPTADNECTSTGMSKNVFMLLFLVFKYSGT